MADEEAQKKLERKEKLKAEAEKLGISYKELKEQKKAAKEKKKRSKEADKLVDGDHKEDMKRMRTWSNDEKDPEQAETKRRRTRSMDAKEEEANKVEAKASLTPAEWRKDQHITVKGHGKYNGDDATAFPEPFLKFSDAPFNARVLKSFSDAGFSAPTSIQSQVCKLSVHDIILCVMYTQTYFHAIYRVLNLISDHTSNIACHCSKHPLMYLFS